MCNRLFSLVSPVVALLLVACSATEELSVNINHVTAEGVGAGIGTVKVTAAEGGGVAFSTDLHGLVPGEHGFHLHENPSCASGVKEDGTAVAAFAAGNHYDPENTGRHDGPDGSGHLGDLPKLVVDDSGMVRATVVAKRLNMTDLHGRTLVIHAGGDNYTDTPPMGGGGARIACGVVQ